MTARPSRAFETTRRFAPVKVSRDRVIREVVGLRPYRASGFVVDAERFGNKLLVHNYGHGGGGVTLSWGTASLAVDLVRDFLMTSRTRPQHFAVLGCGVSGLSTARLLQRRYQNGPGTVTIYAKAVPPDTTSNIAGGRVVVKEFRSRREIARLRETVVFNCTGLGARELFADPELEPVRGQLEILLPQPEIDYCYLSSGYMFPRRDGVILGGTWDHGDWSLEPDAEQANYILEAHTEIMKGLVARAQ